jgi:6,7-dimethyl-8-ribityllumazine synthase
MTDFDDQPVAPPISPPPLSPGGTAAPGPAPVEPQPEEREPEVGEDTDESSGDPFEGWPAAQSAAVIEQTPVDGASVEHVRGEVDVPDGYTVLEGTPLGSRRSVGVVVSRFNGGVTNRMLQTALDTLIELGVSQDAITVMPVPGAFELPLAAMALAKTRRYACIVALGAVVRGDTPHFDYVASECASGLQLAGIETGVPVAFGVLTVENVEQAEARIPKAAESVRSALEMADLFARLRASARQ